MDVFLADISSLTNSSTTTWLILGMSVFAVIYLTVRPRKKKDPLATQPFRTSLSSQRALERDMQNVLVELSEMTRQMTAQLETRANRLESLLREADEKLAQLRDATNTTKSASTEIADILSDTAPVTRPPLRLATDVDHQSEERWTEIYRLADNGLTISQIAQQLRRPTGEIELILALRLKPIDTPNAAQGG